LNLRRKKKTRSWC